MSRYQNQDEADARWDVHVERQISASKGGIAALTVLNSGSWLALLSQVGTISQIPGSKEAAAKALTFWGAGAGVATSTWLFVFLSAIASFNHDLDRKSKFHAFCVDACQIVGVGFAISSLILYSFGVLSIAQIAGNIP